MIPIGDPLTLQQIIDNFLLQQEELGEEFQKILHDNLWNLYETTDEVINDET